MAAVIVVLLFLQTCSCKRNKALSRHLTELRDTCLNWKTSADTHYINAIDTVYLSVPKPFFVETPKYITSEKIVYRSGEVLTPPPDSVVVKDFYAIKYYQDSVKVKYGKVFINDTVTQNSITGRSVITDFSIPVVTNNIFVPEKKKAALYFDLNVQMQGRRYNAAGAGLTLLSRNRKTQYSASALFDRDNKIMYQGGIKLKIH